MTDRTSYADRLYASLPVVYRTRDREEFRNSVLAHYLASCGDLLDALRQTLVQRYADIFPDSNDDDLPCQDWILPYIADLLAVRLVSPEAEGRRQEVANAIDWRQRKGTRRVAEKISESVGQFETELIEGWQKVAVTADINAVKLPATTYGVEPTDASYDALTWKTPASIAARHPTLVAGTVDLRCRAGAVSVEVDTESNPLNQAARRTNFPGAPEKWWRQASLHGAPCKPGAFDDPSRRTPDTRTPRWDRGHAHPRRLLLFIPPPPGLCETPAKIVAWADRATDEFKKRVTVIDDGSSIEIRPAKDAEEPIRITGVLEFNGQDALIEGLNILGTVKIDAGVLTVDRASIDQIEAIHGPVGSPAVIATDALIGSIEAADLIVEIVYTTVVGGITCAEIRTSDSILLAPASNDAGPTIQGCARFSRIDPDQDTTQLSTHQTTTRTPLFFSSTFGEWGCAVLHPATAHSILAGAEDGAEIGAHHHRQYVLREKAVVDKLADFLPLDITPVIVHDAALLEAPAELP